MSESHSQSTGRNASVLNFILTIILSIMMCVYLSLAAYTKDALWFYPVFEAQPVFGVVRCYGEEMVLQEGSEQLAA